MSQNAEVPDFEFTGVEREVIAQIKPLGERGGDRERPELKPERRRSPFQGELLPDGTLGLHRFEQTRDSATIGLKNEQPWHRMAAALLVAGKTNIEVAKLAGVTPQAICTLKTQLWFQQLLAQLANDTGDAVLSRITSEAVASVEKLVLLRDTAESERVQLAAATTLLEQAHGKAVQKVLTITSKTSFASPKDEAEAIKQELAALRAARSSTPTPPEQENSTT